MYHTGTTIQSCKATISLSKGMSQPEGDNLAKITFRKTITRWRRSRSENSDHNMEMAAATAQHTAHSTQHTAHSTPHTAHRTQYSTALDV